MLVSDWLIKNLSAVHLNYIFLVPGGEVDPFVIALGKQQKLKAIVACHEEGAGFMADGYARISENGMGVSMTIGAPGAGNSIPAALAASSDGSSVLFITGGSPLPKMGLATFQETDEDGTNDSRLFSQVVQFSRTIVEEKEFPHVLQEALKHMRDYSAGPAHISVPVDIQKKSIDSDVCLIAPPRLRSVDIEKARSIATELLSKKKKIAFLIGRGAKLSHAKESLLEFIETFEIPFATTASAKGFLPEDHPLALGMFGYAGNQRAIRTFIEEEIEAIFVLGSSLNQRDTLFWDKTFANKKVLIQVDSNPLMIGHNYPVNDHILADIDALFHFWNNEKLNLFKELAASIPERKVFNEKILHNIPLFYDEQNLSSLEVPIHPARLIGAMNNFLPNDTLLFIDSGAHRAFADHYWVCREKRSVCSATNIGPMGWAIPASIGGKLAAPHQPVVAITGDGCMRMHGMEIATAARYRLPVIFVVSNNNALGNVYLRMLKENPEAAEITKLPHIDWVAFGQTLGASGIRVEDPQDLENAFKVALKADGPFIIDVSTSPTAGTPIAPYQEAIRQSLRD